MTRRKSAETAILVTSDRHYGKRTATYSPEVYRQRMAGLSTRLERIHDLLTGSYSIDRLVVLDLGDANDGTGIYPTQEHHQEITNVEQQADELASLQAAWLRRQAKVWKHVDFEWVAGNHGRSGHFSHEAASWDVVAWKYLAHQLKGVKGINVATNEGADLFIRKLEIRGWRYLFYHGHGIRMYQSIPFYGIRQRIMNWAVSSLAPFDVACFGHFHSCGTMPVNNCQAFITGTPVTGDEWALQFLGMESPNRWWLFGSSADRPVTWSFAMDIA